MTIMLLLLLGAVQETAAAGYVAVVTGDVADGSCTIIHKGQRAPCTTRKIYLGDELETQLPLESLGLVTHPAAEVVDLGGGRRQFRMATLVEDDSLARKMVSRFFEQEKHYAVNTVTRGWDNPCRQMVEFARRNPPLAATVLGDVPARFPTPAAVRRVEAVDETGALVFSLAVTGDLVFRPFDLGLAPGREYVLTFEGGRAPRQTKLRVADESEATRLRQAAARAAAAAPESPGLAEAAAFQLLGDLSPDQDYSFLSYQALPPDPTTAPDGQAACNILARYVDALQRALEDAPAP